MFTLTLSDIDLLPWPVLYPFASCTLYNGLGSTGTPFVWDMPKKQKQWPPGILTFSRVLSKPLTLAQGGHILQIWCISCGQLKNHRSPNFPPDLGYFAGASSRADPNDCLHAQLLASKKHIMVKTVRILSHDVAVGLKDIWGLWYGIYRTSTGITICPLP